MSASIATLKALCQAFNDHDLDRITKRGQRILDVDLGEEPSLPKPQEESLPFTETAKGRK